MRRYFKYDHKLNRIVPARGAAPKSLSAENYCVGEAHYYGLRHTDGTDISSRKKHKNFMRRNNLTTVDDFKNTWAAQRNQHDRGLRSDIGRSIHELGGD